MTDDSELEQRLRRELAELGAVPEARDRERRAASRRLPTATLLIALVVVLALVATSFAIVRKAGDGKDDIGFDPKPTATTTTTTTTTKTTVAPLPTTTTAATNTANITGRVSEFFPMSRSTWWAIFTDDVAETRVVARTIDAGRHWQKATPPGSDIASSSFLNADVAWVERGDQLQTPEQEPVYRTLDGGRSWKRIGMVPTYCQLQFLDPLNGWCTRTGGAAGSASVDLLRTSDGGATWTLISHTDFDAAKSTPGALPLGCGKTITFTSLTIGWSSFACNGGEAPVYGSSDGGARWNKLGPVPLPAGAPDPSGSELSVPVVRGANVAVVHSIGGQPGATAIVTSADGGRSWRSQLIPGAHRYWNVDLVDPTHWRATDGAVFIATDDAGAHWRTTPAVAMKSPDGTTFTLTFLTPVVGWAVPARVSNGGVVLQTADGGVSWQPVKVP